MRLRLRTAGGSAQMLSWSLESHHRQEVGLVEPFPPAFLGDSLDAESMAELLAWIEGNMNRLFAEREG